ncbi:MAG: ribose 5-phosphate isomerase B, partial [Deltaproteobacteria bacterium]|nr:ribose 5-phosphate isomerase B [Deltaproteobacteria bacterium]
MRIAIGADHGGFELKEHLKRWLAGRGHEVDDCGAFDTNPVDYPVIAAAVGRKVAQGKAVRGIVVDGAGIGSAMAANKLYGVRAALCYDVSSARNSREHNDANVLTLGARLIGVGLAEQIAEVFVTTECTEERHRKRVAMIEALEHSPEQAMSAGYGGGEGPCAPCAAKALAGRAPSVDSSASDERARAFRASAAQQLQGAPAAPAPRPSGSSPSVSTPRESASRSTPTSPSTMSQPMKLDDLSPEDLARVADRIASMLGTATPRGNLVCFGDVCMDARVAKQWIG